MSDGSKHTLYVINEENFDKVFDENGAYEAPSIPWIKPRTEGAAQVIFDSRRAFARMGRKTWNPAAVTTSGLFDYDQIVEKPIFIKQRHTACTLSLSKNKLESKEIKDTRMSGDFQFGTGEVVGAINTELPIHGVDLFLESGLMGKFKGREDVPEDDESGSFSPLYPLSVYKEDYAYTQRQQLVLGDTRSKLAVVRGFSQAGSNHYDYLVYEGVEVSSINITASPGEHVGLSFECLGRSCKLIEGYYGNPPAHQDFYKRYVKYIPPDEAKPDSQGHLNFDGFETITKDSFPWEVNHQSILIPSEELTRTSLTAGEIRELFKGCLGNLPDTSPLLTTLHGYIIFGGGFNRPIEELKRKIVTELQMTIDNGLKSRYVLGSRESLSPAVGRLSISGTLTVYFDDLSDYLLFLAEKESVRLAIGFRSDRSGGEWIEIQVGGIKIDSAPTDVNNDGPIVIPLSYSAVDVDGTQASYLSVTKFTSRQEDDSGNAFTYANDVNRHEFYTTES
ncbi:MAG: phage tail tube protein [Candidatus Thiodiazotropha endolucinida]|nr:phage tail tube protein [Candidatus Thiodiazotropha taylori]MCW4321601.1 phage tail tube protein [Candidatus Thiodiazotropha taylori]